LLSIRNATGSALLKFLGARLDPGDFLALLGLKIFGERSGLTIGDSGKLEP
jgi:hypothetical protein